MNLRKYNFIFQIFFYIFFYSYFLPLLKAEKYIKNEGLMNDVANANTRKINEMLATDPTLTPAEKQAFARIMAQAAAEGMDGDHIIEVSRVANAVRNMTPERRAAYFKVFRNANVALGNDPKNIQKLTKELNQIVKPAEIRSLDNALRGMDTRGKSLLQEMLGIE